MRQLTVLAPARPRPRQRWGLGNIRALLRALAERAELARQRRALARLEPRLLADIGVSARQARREAARPPSDVPPTWMR
ncbi:MAG: hypothetical protein Kow0058_18620 [Roseovarius sp.]